MSRPFWSLVLAGAFLAPLDAVAQRATIIGHVLRRDTRLPIEGAVVTVAGTKLSVTTAANGSFTIVGISPGKYTVVAKRFGYSTVELRALEVDIDRRREITFELRESNVDSVEVIDAVPMIVDPKIVTAMTTVSSEKVLSLPSMTLPGALSVNGGYVQVARSGANLTVTDFRRGITSLPSVRGARAEATGYLLDGIDVSNPFYGTLPILAEPLATSSVSFAPSHFDAEYGNAMSGLVNQALREGGDRIEGAMEYQTSGLAGRFSDANGETRAHAMRGYLSGPMPIKRDAFRFALAGHSVGDRLSVLRAPGASSWRGTGDYAHSQAVAKLSYAVTPDLRLSLTALGQRRSAIDVDQGFLTGDSVAAAATGESTRLLIARGEQRFSRAYISFAVASTHSDRQTCSVWNAVCVEDRLQRIPLASEIPLGLGPRQTPYAITGPYFGGESYRTSTVRADVTLQATDHNQVKFGFYSASHDLEYAGVYGVRFLHGVIIPSRDVYRAHPTELSSYVQHAFEHDLLTVRMGVRFDYAKPDGSGFVNPLDITNGTNAADVCNGTAPGINETPFTYGNESGLRACNAALAAHNSALFDSATSMARRDDMRPASARSAVSPRIGISLPVSEESVMYFNYGRYARNPLYHDMYRNTGTGSVAGMSLDADRVCETWQNTPGTNECRPQFLVPAIVPEFVGNPLLPFETASLWEAGVSSRLGRVHSINVTFFSNTEDHLPTLYATKQPLDPGATYGPIGDRPTRVVLPTGSLLTTGLSVTIRRRLLGALKYSFNYTYTKSSEVGARPDLLAESLARSFIDTLTALFDNSTEQSSRRNQPHLFNGEASLQWRDNYPKAAGRVGTVLMRNAQAAVTISAASGSSSMLQADCFALDKQCSIQSRRAKGTGTIVNLLYSKAVTSSWPVWSFVVRVQNVLNADDGSADLIRLPFLFGGGTYGNNQAPRGDVSLRRILTGMTVTF